MSEYNKAIQGKPLAADRNDTLEGWSSIINRLREPAKREHKWDRDGERCVLCGDKDWMESECRGRK